MSTGRYFGLRDYWLKHPDVAVPSAHSLAKLRILRGELDIQEISSSHRYYPVWIVKETLKQVRLTNHAIDNIIRRMPA